MCDDKDFLLVCEEVKRLTPFFDFLGISGLCEAVRKATGKYGLTTEFRMNEDLTERPYAANVAVIVRHDGEYCNSAHKRREVHGTGCHEKVMGEAEYEALLAAIIECFGLKE